MHWELSGICEDPHLLGPDLTPDPEPISARLCGLLVQ
jgi:hypothetical protein